MTQAQYISVFVVFVGVPLLLLLWEGYTLFYTKDKGDHITAILRKFTDTGLGKLVLWLAGIIQGAVLGHAFHDWG